MTTILIPTSTHGRVLIEDAAGVAPAGDIVAFHGYGQNADDILRDIRRVPEIDRWRRIAPQALHRFYTRDNTKVVASWMTREDREAAIADNVTYIDRVLDQASGLRPEAAAERAPGPDAVENEARGPRPGAGGLIFLGFSQGAAMAYRAAILGSHRATAVIAIAGDIPPELKSVPAMAWPRVLLAGGTGDQWYTPAKLDTDASFLTSHEIPHEVLRFDGAHEWTDEVREGLVRFLNQLRETGRDQRL